MEASFSLSAVEDFLQQTNVDDQQANMAAATLPSIKIEEHVAPSTITPDLLSLDSPEPTSSSSKQPKKRKSWGQVLPEPKTTLPPRKRAKTADEKEQRRIERVKRNRLAAHNSRERKREEMEQLQVVNDGLVAQMEAMREQMKAMVAEISALRGGSSSAAIPSSVSSFDFTTITKHESYTKQQSAPSVLSPPMTATTSALQTPELGNLDSPDMEIGDEFPTTPMEDGFGGENLCDPTQQSAALLCDLQCRSQRFLSCHNSSGQPTQSQSPSNNYQQQLLPMALITFQLNLQIFLSSVSTLSSTSTVMRLARRLLPATATQPTTSSSTSPLPSLLSMICWTTALARQATSSTSSQPTKAHLQKVATGLAAKLRMELTHSSSPSLSSCEETRVGGVVDGHRRRGPRRSRARRRIVMTWDVKSAISGVASVRGNRDPRLQQALQKLAERSLRR